MLQKVLVEGSYDKKHWTDYAKLSRMGIFESSENVVKLTTSFRLANELHGKDTLEITPDLQKMVLTLVQNTNFEFSLKEISDIYVTIKDSLRIDEADYSLGAKNELKKKAIDTLVNKNVKVSELDDFLLKFAVWEFEGEEMKHLASILEYKLAT